MAAFLGGIADTVFDVLWKTTVQTKIDSSERARLTSFEECASLVSVPLGFAAGGILDELIGAQAALVGGSVLLVGAVASVLLVPSVRGLRAAEISEATSDAGSLERQPESG